MTLKMVFPLDLFRLANHVLFEKRFSVPRLLSVLVMFVQKQIFRFLLPIAVSLDLVRCRIELFDVRIVPPLLLHSR